MCRNLQLSGLNARAIQKQHRNAILNRITFPAFHASNSSFSKLKVSMARRAYNHLQNLTNSLHALHVPSLSKQKLAAEN